MAYAIGSALLFLAILTRIPYRRIAIENNGGFFLLGCRDRARGERPRGHPWVPLTHELLYRLYRIFGNWKEFRWIRDVGITAHVGTVGAFLAGGMLLNRPVWGLAAAGLYLIPATLPHMISWFTCPEWYGLPFAAAGFVVLELAPAWGPAATVGAGFLFLVPAGFKLSGILGWAGVASALAATGRMEEALLFAVPSGIAGGVALAVLFGRAGIEEIRALRRYKRAETRLRLCHGARAQIRRMGQVVRDLGPALAWLLLGTGLFLAAGFRVENAPLLGWTAGAFAELALQRIWTAGHWVPLLPPTAALGGIGVERLAATGGTTFWISLGIAGGGLLAWGIASGLRNRWRPGPSAEFQEQLARTARWVRDRTAPEDPVFFWGFHPQLQLLADRPNPAPDLAWGRAVFLDRFRPGWRRELAEGFAKHPPRLVVRIGQQDFPLEGLTALLGLRYIREPVPGDFPEALQDSVLRLAEPPATGESFDFDAALEQLYEKGIETFRAGDWNTALRLVRASIEMDPEHPAGTRLFDLIRHGLVRKETPADQPSIDLLPIGSGVLRVTVDRGETVVFDERDPRADGPPTDDIGHAIFLGLGLGQRIDRRIRSLPRETEIWIVERSLPLYYVGIRRIPSLLDPDRPVRILIGKTAAEVVDALDSLPIAGTCLETHPAATALFADYYGRIGDGLARAWDLPTETAPEPEPEEVAA